MARTAGSGSWVVVALLAAGLVTVVRVQPGGALSAATPGTGASPAESWAAARGPGAPPDPSPRDPNWVDEAVRSRAVLCATTATHASRDAAGEALAEHLACKVTMTDPRVGGDLSADLTIVFAPGSSEAGAWTGTFRLANHHGSWEGSAHGAATRGKNEAAAPALWGTVVYRGSGAYAGLAYTQLLAGEGTLSIVSGWFSGPALPERSLRLANLDAGRGDPVALAGLGL